MNNDRLRRSAQLIEDRIWRIEQIAEREIIRIHRRYLTRIDEMIDSFIATNSIDGVLNLDRIRQPMTANELMEYILKMQNVVASLQQSASPGAMQVAVRINSMLLGITRLGALETEIDAEIAQMYIETQRVMENVFRRAYEETFYRTSHSIAVSSRLGTRIPRITEMDLLDILRYNWSGETYDNRLWNNRNAIMGAIRQMLFGGYRRGNMNHAAREIRSAIGWTSIWQIRRLLTTETTFFSERGNEKAYEENDVEWYEIIETLDERTCEKCQPFDGQVFRVSERQQGVNAPTFHPNCRGCTAPHFPEEEVSEWRRARDENNQGTLVPGNMNYQEWLERFVI